MKVRLRGFDDKILELKVRGSFEVIIILIYGGVSILTLISCNNKAIIIRAISRAKDAKPIICSLTLGRT